MFNDTTTRNERMNRESLLTSIVTVSLGVLALGLLTLIVTL